MSEERTTNIDYKEPEREYSKASIGEETFERSPIRLENLPELIVPELAAKYLKKSIKTLYDWKYRGKMRKEKIPPNLFVKLGGCLYLRKDVLLDWTYNRSSS